MKMMELTAFFVLLIDFGKAVKDGLLTVEDLSVEPGELQPRYKGWGEIS